MDPRLRHLRAALLYMEPASTILALARQSDGKLIDTECQMIILKHFTMNEGHEIGNDNPHDYVYAKSILKNLILALESTQSTVVEGLYEQFSLYLTIDTKWDSKKRNNKICRSVSFYLMDGHNDIHSKSMNLVAKLKSSLNMLEGDTGCTLWPSGLFLSEFILSYPMIFSNRVCVEVGSGTGLTGISLSHVGASKVILTEGDQLSFENMKSNIEMNQIPTETQVMCKLLPWETASDGELQTYQADIVLGADIIYDPQCIPHLIRVLSVLLNAGTASRDLEAATSACNNLSPCSGDGDRDTLHGKTFATPIAYIATVIRNPDTFLCFCEEASRARLSVTEITESKKPLDLLPYMLSYDRPSVRLYLISSSKEIVSAKSA